MWPASDSSANDPVATAATISTTVVTTRTARAATNRGRCRRAARTRAAPWACPWTASWPSAAVRTIGALTAAPGSTTGRRSVLSTPGCRRSPLRPRSPHAVASGPPGVPPGCHPCPPVTPSLAGMSGSRRSPGASVALVVGLLAAVLATVLVLGRPADAHARLVSTVPGADEVVDVAPQSVELRFDEAVDVTGRAVRVFDPAGVRVEAGEPRTSEDGRLVSVDVEADDPGTYTVAWRVTSADGLTISGSFVYHVDDRLGDEAIDESTSVLVSAVGGVGRWAGFAGGLLAVGAAALALVADGAGESGRARLRSVVVVGAVVGSVGVLAALVAALAESAGRGLGDV